MFVSVLVMYLFFGILIKCVNLKKKIKKLQSFQIFSEEGGHKKYGNPQVLKIQIFTANITQDFFTLLLGIKSKVPFLKLRTKCKNIHLPRFDRCGDGCSGVLMVD